MEFITFKEKTNSVCSDSLKYVFLVARDLGRKPQLLDEITKQVFLVSYEHFVWVCMGSIEVSRTLSDYHCVFTNWKLKLGY